MKIVKVGPAYVGTLKIPGEPGGHYACGKDRREVIDKWFKIVIAG